MKIIDFNRAYLKYAGVESTQVNYIIKLKGNHIFLLKKRFNFFNYRTNNY